MADTTNPQETDTQSQDNSFNVLGMSKNMRRNLVVTIMVIQFSAIMALWHQTISLNNKIDEIRTAEVDSSNAMYNRLISQIAAKMAPVQQQVNLLNKNLDSLNNCNTGKK